MATEALSLVYIVNTVWDRHLTGSNLEPFYFSICAVVFVRQFYIFTLGHCYAEKNKQTLINKEKKLGQPSVLDWWHVQYVPCRWKTCIVLQLGTNSYIWPCSRQYIFDGWTCTPLKQYYAYLTFFFALTSAFSHFWLKMIGITQHNLVILAPLCLFSKFIRLLSPLQMTTQTVSDLVLSSDWAILELLICFCLDSHLLWKIRFLLILSYLVKLNVQV